MPPQGYSHPANPLPPESERAQSWTLGPYSLNSQGDLLLGPTAIHLPPLQRRLLVSLARRRGQVLSREQLLEEVWGHQQVSEVSISRTVHGLRRAFSRGPLGQGVIRTIYGGGYRLEVPIRPVRAGGETVAGGQEGAPFPSSQTLSAFVEGLVLVRQRDPRLLERAAGHLRRCLEMAADFTPAQVQLAAIQLSQYHWGLLPAQAVEADLEPLLLQAEASDRMASEVLALRVQALSLLHWQPDLAEARFAGWLPGQLLGSPSLHSWALHLLATGRAAEAIPLLEPLLHPDNPDGWLLTALAWWLLNGQERSIACLQQLLGLDGDLLAARLLLALQLAESSRRAEALRELKISAICDDPDNGLQAIGALVQALCGQGPPAAARLRRALAGPDLTMTSLWGVVALAVGEEATATDLLERALRDRCGLAPLLQHFPVLQRYRDSPALRRFRNGMTNRFPCTF